MIFESRVNEPAARLASRAQVAPPAGRGSIPHEDGFSGRQCRGKKISLAVLAARHGSCGYGAGFEGFYYGRRSRGRFLLMKYGGGRFTPPAAFFLLEIGPFYFGLFFYPLV